MKSQYEILRNESICDQKNKHSCFISDYKYCIECNIFTCKTCFSYFHLQEHGNHFDSCIPSNQLSNICLRHNKEIQNYCKDCEKNICKECEKEFHKRHGKIEIEKTRVKDAQAEINKNKRKLFLMKQFYDMVCNASINSNETIYKKNVVNIAQCITKTKNRNKFDEDLAIYRIKQIKERNKWK